MTLADRDETLLIAPSRSFVLEYSKPVNFLRWRWHRTTRERVTLRTLSLGELQQIQRVYAELEKTIGLDLVKAVAILIGPGAFHMSPKQIELLWDAHCELNLIPKVEAAVAAESPTPPSSVASNGGLSSSSEGAS